MHYFPLKLFALAVAFSVTFVSAHVSADPGGNHKAGKNGHYKGEKRNKGDGAGSPGNDYPMRGFDERQRLAVHNYFTPRFQSGHCPPGLAKKHNGCIPPGHAKKWRVGYPLPQGMIYHLLPPHLVSQLGLPGPGYRYVRVAADVLLIAAGTGLVIDAIQDLNAM
jgi:Ni/Co efflux regulator RcnB